MALSIMVLKLAWEMGAKNVISHCDSSQAVNTVTRPWSFQFECAYRESNFCVDGLAKLASAAKGGKAKIRLSVFEVLVFLVLILALVKVQRVCGDARNYITWDDLKVKEHSVASNVDKVIVVDQSGNGDSTTVQGAVDMVPDDNRERVKIYIYPGTYRERVHVPINKPFISFIGKPNITINDTNRLNRMANANAINVTEIGNSLPVITNSTKASDKGSNGQEMGTVGTATVWVESDFFCTTDLIIENLVDEDADGRQAVALRVDGDKAVFYRVRLVGEQDTLLDNIGTHYFYQCYIQGSVDFICGQAKSLYHECTLYSVADYWGAIAAHHRDSEEEDTGFSFVGCNITGTGSILLGRAWRQYATTIYSYCNMDDIINPIGWSDWDEPSRQRTVMFGEYLNTGRGSNRTGRVEWSKNLTTEEAKPFLNKDYINRDNWLRLY